MQQTKSFTAEEFLIKEGFNPKHALYKDVNDYVLLADILSQYHDYALDRAAEIEDTTEVETYPPPFSDSETYVSRNSILNLKHNK